MPPPDSAMPSRIPVGGVSRYSAAWLGSGLAALAPSAISALPASLGVAQRDPVILVGGVAAERVCGQRLGTAQPAQRPHVQVAGEQWVEAQLVLVLRGAERGVEGVLEVRLVVALCTVQPDADGAD